MELPDGIQRFVAGRRAKTKKPFPERGKRPVERLPRGAISSGWDADAVSLRRYYPDQVLRV
jgi:hypothetical protein